MLFQSPLPSEYTDLTTVELVERVAALRARLGDRLVILGHHYQQDEVIRFADFTGDSYKLAKLAAEREEAEFIVFCGVHFMAESADILKKGEQVVVLPDLSAGCSMADMADLDQVEECWETLQDRLDPFDVVPVTYMNSSAAIKAHVGREGGAVCTSSNADRVFEWAFERGGRILFLPDEHLGRNVGHALGIPLEEMPVWNPHEPDGGLAPEQIEGARVILWRGHCSVHARFLPEHVDRMRDLYPGIRVIAHPEARWEVVQKSDQWGSTERIIQAVEGSPAGSQWAVATEHHLVDRLAQRNPDKLVVNLAGFVCQCATMYRIDLPHLYWALDHLARGEIVNRIAVPAEMATAARLALQRMLDAAPAPAPAPVASPG